MRVDYLPRQNADIVELGFKFQAVGGLSTEQAQRFEQYREVLCTLERVGYENPIMFGGALRDLVLEIDPRDLDVATTTELPNGKAHFEGGLIQEEIELEDVDFPVNLIHKPEIMTVWDAAASSDAPIHSVAMDENGFVLADVNFEAHVDQKLFSTFNGLDDTRRIRAVRRFAKLQARHPEMRFVTDMNHYNEIASDPERLGAFCKQFAGISLGS